jgi:tetratricopeptide (TPR) repeat protein
MRGRGPLGALGGVGALALALVLVASAAGCAHPDAVARAQSLSRQNRDDDAVALLQKDLTAHPDDVPARRLLVRILASTGNLLAARGQVEELARWMPPNDPAPFIELGHAFELNHKYDEALEAYDQAASVAPASPAGPREGGMRAARWGELEMAEPRLAEALRRGAGDAETWHTLGLVRLHRDDYEGAAAAYRSGAASDPKCGPCWLGVATVGLMQSDPAMALEGYDHVLALSPRFASAQLGRAWALAQLGRVSEAGNALDTAQDLGAPPGPIARQRAALAGARSSPAPVAPIPPSASTAASSRALEPPAPADPSAPGEPGRPLQRAE